MKKIPVLEIFGPTIQGEGNVIGRKTMFVRTAGCDYQCSWCDSKFTWDGSVKAQMMTSSEIIQKLLETGGENFDHVTISGGNPALISAIGELIADLHEMDIEVGVETQGSKWQEWFLYVNDLTISPKPPSSKMKTDFLKLSSILKRLEQNIADGKATLKIVVFGKEDFEYAKYIHKYFPHVPMFLQVGNAEVSNMDTDEMIPLLLDSLEDLVDMVMKDKDMNDVRVLPQLHTLLWGNRKGV